MAKHTSNKMNEKEKKKLRIKWEANTNITNINMQS